MRMEIIRRVIDEAYYILETEKTIRAIAFTQNVSKSTVHKDLHERLKEIDKDIFISVDKILQEHLDVRHIRGGESTKQKYLNLKGN
ncbi:MAG: sporulation transcriptional regulator SpoIIID [Bacilli bacterium]|nr:sporulation transcriptional regulator SpoIIID [Bacilli bacterium]